MTDNKITSEDLKNLANTSVHYLLLNIPSAQQPIFIPFLREFLCRFFAYSLSANRKQTLETLAENVKIFPSLLDWLEKKTVHPSLSLISHYIKALEDLLCDGQEDHLIKAPPALSNPIKIAHLEPALRMFILSLLAKKPLFKDKFQKLENTICSRFNSSQIKTMFHWLQVENIHPHAFNQMTAEEFSLLESSLSRYEQEKKLTEMRTKLLITKLVNNGCQFLLVNISAHQQNFILPFLRELLTRFFKAIVLDRDNFLEDDNNNNNNNKLSLEEQCLRHLETCSTFSNWLLKQQSEFKASVQQTLFYILALENTLEKQCGRKLNGISVSSEHSFEVPTALLDTIKALALPLDTFKDLDKDIFKRFNTEQIKKILHWIKYANLSNAIINHIQKNEFYFIESAIFISALEENKLNIQIALKTVMSSHLIDIVSEWAKGYSLSYLINGQILLGELLKLSNDEIEFLSDYHSAFAKIKSLRLTVDTIKIIYQRTRVLPTASLNDEKNQENTVSNPALTEVINSLSLFENELKKGNFNVRDFFKLSKTTLFHLNDETYRLVFSLFFKGCIDATAVNNFEFNNVHVIESLKIGIIYRGIENNLLPLGELNSLALSRLEILKSNEDICNYFALNLVKAYELNLFKTYLKKSLSILGNPIFIELIYKNQFTFTQLIDIHFSKTASKNLTSSIVRDLVFNLSILTAEDIQKNDFTALDDNGAQNLSEKSILDLVKNNKLDIRVINKTNGSNPVLMKGLRCEHIQTLLKENPDLISELNYIRSDICLKLLQDKSLHQEFSKRQLPDNHIHFLNENTEYALKNPAISSLFQQKQLSLHIVSLINLRNDYTLILIAIPIVQEKLKQKPEFINTLNKVTSAYVCSALQEDYILTCVFNNEISINALNALTNNSLSCLKNKGLLYLLTIFPINILNNINIKNKITCWILENRFYLKSIQENHTYLDSLNKLENPYAVDFIKRFQFEVAIEDLKDISEKTLSLCEYEVLRALILNKRLRVSQLNSLNTENPIAMALINANLVSLENTSIEDINAINNPVVLEILQIECYKRAFTQQKVSLSRLNEIDSDFFESVVKKHPIEHIILNPTIPLAMLKAFNFSNYIIPRVFQSPALMTILQKKPELIPFINEVNKDETLDFLIQEANAVIVSKEVAEHFYKTASLTISPRLPMEHSIFSFLGHQIHHLNRLNCVVQNKIALSVINVYPLRKLFADNICSINDLLFLNNEKIPEFISRVEIQNALLEKYISIEWLNNINNDFVLNIVLKINIRTAIFNGELKIDQINQALTNLTVDEQQQILILFDYLYICNSFINDQNSIKLFLSYIKNKKCLLDYFKNQITKTTIEKLQYFNFEKMVSWSEEDIKFLIATPIANQLVLNNHIDIKSTKMINYKNNFLVTLLRLNSLKEKLLQYTAGENSNLFYELNDIQEKEYRFFATYPSILFVFLDKKISVTIAKDFDDKNFDNIARFIQGVSNTELNIELTAKFLNEVNQNIINAFQHNIIKEIFVPLVRFKQPAAPKVGSPNLRPSFFAEPNFLYPMIEPKSGVGFLEKFLNSLFQFVPLRNDTLELVKKIEIQRALVREKLNWVTLQELTPSSVAILKSNYALMVAFCDKSVTTSSLNKIQNNQEILVKLANKDILAAYILNQVPIEKIQLLTSDILCLCLKKDKSFLSVKILTTDMISATVANKITSNIFSLIRDDEFIINMLSTNNFDIEYLSSPIIHLLKSDPSLHQKMKLGLVNCFKLRKVLEECVILKLNYIYLLISKNMFVPKIKEQFANELNTLLKEFNFEQSQQNFDLNTFYPTKFNRLYNKLDNLRTMPQGFRFQDTWKHFLELIHQELLSLEKILTNNAINLNTIIDILITTQYEITKLPLHFYQEQENKRWLSKPGPEHLGTPLTKIEARETVHHQHPGLTEQDLMHDSHQELETFFKNDKNSKWANEADFKIVHDFYEENVYLFKSWPSFFRHVSKPIKDITPNVQNDNSNNNNNNNSQTFI